MISELFKILAILLVSATIAVLLNQYRPEYAVMIVTAAAVAVLIIVIKNVFPSISKIRGLIEKSGVSSVYFATALKALGIAYISGFVADTCRDFGQTSLASKAELAGKCAVFVLSVPLMCTVLETALGFAGL